LTDPRESKTKHLRRRARAIALSALLLASLPLVTAAPIATATEPAARAEIRGDLAALVAGTATQDPRLQQLIAGLKASELAYFVVLDVKNDTTRAAAIKALGARVVRTYRTINAFEVVSTPVTVLRIADLSWVDWLAPVEVVHALADPVPDQSRGKTADVGAPPVWAQGITGKGIRIAILDTGVDSLHPDLDDLDFRNWTGLLPNPPKVVDSRNFNGGGCAPIVGDGHGHGTHVAAIAAGTGEGGPTTDDDGKYLGIAPDAQLVVGKVLTDAGIGNNADLVAALEWAALPADPSPTGCGAGADVVNMSLGSDARPVRLNSGRDGDLVSLTLDRLAIAYGTVFVASMGNSGPYIGSALEAPGSAYHAIAVGASAKDWDLNHDNTLSGDTCSGWQHPRSPSPADNDCRAGAGTQGPSVATFSSRGPSGDLWLRPDVVAPGVNIVSAQATHGALIAANDYAVNTRTDPLYATASGTSMAAPATTGSAALVLDAYRQAHGGADPSGSAGLTGLTAKESTLVRAALMNTAGSDMYEARWILTVDSATRIRCPADLDPLLFTICDAVQFIGNQFIDIVGSSTVGEVRNGAADPYVGPLAEGAGKINIGRAIAALSNGVVIYSAASGSGASAGTGPQDLQGTWQVGAIAAGASNTQQFVLHNAPGAPATIASFAFVSGNPSDGSHPISASAGWSVTLPGSASLYAGGTSGSDKSVTFSITAPATAKVGAHAGAVIVTLSNGTVLRVPVFASVTMHDPNLAAGNAPGAQAAVISARDVFAKDDTLWPSAAGQALGATADWLVYGVELAPGLASATFAVWDTDAGNETYDIYVYDAHLDLIDSSHPFAADGVSDAAAQAQRGPSTAAAPTTVTLLAPPAGRHYVAVNRARIGRLPIDPIGDFGSFKLTLDEVGPTSTPVATALAYSGDYVFVAGQPGRLAATLTDASGAPIRGRTITFTFDDNSVTACAGGCQAITNIDGVAQLAFDASLLAAGVHEVHARFAGDTVVGPSAADAFVLVLAAGGPLPPPVGGGTVSGGGWFVPDGGVDGPGDQGRIHVALHARGDAATATGELRWRDRDSGLDLRLASWRLLFVSGDGATLLGSAVDAAGTSHDIEVTVHDAGEPGKDHDTIRLRFLDGSYDRSGTLGGGNLQVAAG